MTTTAHDPPVATGRTPAPGAPGLPGHISPTGAKAYLGCSLRFYFERVACIRRPTSPALHIGKAVHAALQRFHLALWRGEDHSPETVSDFFFGVYDALEKDEGPVDWSKTNTREKCREDGQRVVAAYLASPEALKENERPRAVEVLLRETVPGLSVPLTGAMDLVEDNFTPVDFKSAAAKPNPTHAAFDHEIQLVSYQLLLEIAAGEVPPSLDLVFLVKTKTPQVIRVSSRPADAHRKRRVVSLLETAVEGIATGRFHPQPAMHCSWCAYRSECLAWTPDGIPPAPGTGTD
jgi:putative RecB family exonuclease